MEKSEEEDDEEEDGEYEIAEGENTSFMRCKKPGAPVLLRGCDAGVQIFESSSSLSEFRLLGPPPYGMLHRQDLGKAADVEVANLCLLCLSASKITRGCCVFEFPADTCFGIVTARDAGQSFCGVQLEVYDSDGSRWEVLLESTDLAPETPLHENTLAAFHEQAMLALLPENSEGGSVPTPALFVLINNVGGKRCVDRDQMHGFLTRVKAGTNAGSFENGEYFKNAPWLAPCLRRWYCLNDLHRISTFAPTFPIEPEAMEASFAASRSDEEQAKDVLQLLGRTVMSVLIEVGSFGKAAETACLSRDVVGKCMLPLSFAEYFVLRGDAQCPIEEPHSGQVSSNACQVKMMEALLGSYFLSGCGFYSAWHIFRFLLNRSEQEHAIPSWARDECDGDGERCDRFLGYHLFGLQTGVKGKTPTLRTLKETTKPRGIKELEVVYENAGTRGFTGSVIYRRASAETKGRVMERVNAEWQCLRWCQKRKTFVSSRVFGPDPGLDAESSSACVDGPVPNKVANWLLGSNMQSLVISIKHKGKMTPDDNVVYMVEIPMQRRSVLLVKYIDAIGCFCTVRTRDGGLGKEYKVDEKDIMSGDILGAVKKARSQKVPIYYSEEFKCLMSDSTDGPVARKVTEWLRLRCLAEVANVPSGKGEAVAGDVDFPDETHARWTHSMGSFVYSVERDVVQNCLFVEVDRRCTRDGRRQPLIYSQTLKTWLSPGLFFAKNGDATAARLPEEIVRWLARQGGSVSVVAKLCCPGVLRQRSPYCAANDVEQVAVRTSGVCVPDAEQKLRHSFNNKLLLAHALTHGPARVFPFPKN